MTEAADRWSAFEKIAFRFGFVYLILYCWPNSGRSSLLDAIPGFGAGSADDNDTQRLIRILEAPFHGLCSWAAVHVFRLHGSVTQYHPTGSGDTTLDYIQVFCFAVIAAIAALAWSLLDRRRVQYRLLYAWLRLLVRFTLAFTMLAYGFAKIFPLQFGSGPLLSQLTETYGEASPMGLLWTFMGASIPYTIFSGGAEVIAGLLLLFRRTTTLGALVAIAVLTNIVALNFCYDVPVKLYSLHLLLMSIFLLLSDIAALWSFFVLHRMSRPEGVWLPKFERVWLSRAAIVLQILVVASVLFNNIWGSYKATKENAAELKHPLLYGIWEIDRFRGDGPPSGAAWHRMIVETAGYLMFRTATGDAVGFQTTYDEAKHHLKLTSRRRKETGEFTYRQPDSGHLVLEGSLNAQPVAIELHRIDAGKFLLTSRGFHWINEDPFNR